VKSFTINIVLYFTLWASHHLNFVVTISWNLQFLICWKAMYVMLEVMAWNNILQLFSLRGINNNDMKSQLLLSDLHFWIKLPGDVFSLQDQSVYFKNKSSKNWYYSLFRNMSCYDCSSWTGEDQKTKRPVGQLLL